MKLNVKQTVYIGLGFMSIMLLWGVYNWFIPLFLDDYLKELFKASDILIGIIMALDNLFALFMIPLMSKLSDKTNTKLGKRMPYITIGIILSAISFAFIPLTKSISPLLLIGNIFIVLISMNIYRSPCVALMPDVTIKPLRNKGNSIINILGGAGTAIAYILNLVFGKTNPNLPFCTVSFLMLLLLVIMLIKVKENKMVENYYQTLKDNNLDLDDDKIEDEPTNSRLNTNKRNVLLVLFTVLFIYMANNSIETWLSLYSEEIYINANVPFNLNPGTLILIPFGISTFAMAIPSALIADKIGRKKAIMIGCILLAIGYLGIGLIGIFIGFSYICLIFNFINGIGFSLITINIYPMVVENCANKEIGTYTGKYYTYSMIAQSITPALSGLFVSGLVFNTMNALYPYGIVFILFAFISISNVKE